MDWVGWGRAGEREEEERPGGKGLGCALLDSGGFQGVMLGKGGKIWELEHRAPSRDRKAKRKGQK